MPGRYEIELEPEVRSWLDSLPLEQYAKAEAMADLLAERARAAQQACEQGHAAGHPGHGPARKIYERKWD